jgi:regulatory protein
MEKKAIKARLPFEQAVEKAKKYCAYQERSQQEVRNRLFGMGLYSKEVEQAIALLVSEGFINECRFAVQFAKGKFRIKNWGLIKIELGLRAKNVSANCIKIALKEIDREEYLKVLKKLVSSRLAFEKEKHPFRKNQKVARYVIGRGFEPGLVWDMLGGHENE